eukprot:GHRR01021985.1.p1 GENE.GHRR01021985.1~~GHRR01021985.1.p1  ORF type:complete len:214 (+),score=29.90 GHRR01021985.1:1099-1740(+)
MKLSRRQYRVTCCWALILASVGGLWSILLVRNCLSIDQNPFTDGQTAYYAQSRGTCYRRTSRCTATVSASPSNTVAQMSSCFKAVPSRVQESCATIAASHVPDQTEITSLAPGSRQMPSVATESPVLAASNWDGQVNADHIGRGRNRMQAALSVTFYFRRVLAWASRLSLLAAAQLICWCLLALRTDSGTQGVSSQEQGAGSGLAKLADRPAI